jgi:hypothetical protein
MTSQGQILNISYKTSHPNYSQGLTMEDCCHYHLNHPELYDIPVPTHHDTYFLWNHLLLPLISNRSLWICWLQMLWICGTSWCLCMLHANLLHISFSLKIGSVFMIMLFVGVLAIMRVGRQNLQILQGMVVYSFLLKALHHLLLPMNGFHLRIHCRHFYHLIMLHVWMMFLILYHSIL